ncbi:MAG: hypothetical protein AB7F19_03085 [Candidatus Babeliales bacterium]
MKRTNLYILIILLSSYYTQAKILIFTFAYNRPDFIEIQYQTFSKFLSEEFELIVFNDATEQTAKKGIEQICTALNLICVTIPQKIHARPYLNRPDKSKPHAAIRNCNVVQYAMDIIGFDHNDILMLVDSDLFLIREFDIRNFIQNHHAAAFMRPCSDVPEKYHNCTTLHPHVSGISYFWIGLVILNMNSLPHKYALNFNRGTVQTVFGPSFVDAGGYSYYSKTCIPNFKAKPIIRTCFQDIICTSCKEKNSAICTHSTATLQHLGVPNDLIKLLQQIPLDPRKEQADRGIELFNAGTFLHYRSGSNWNKASRAFIANKDKAFNNLIKTILEQE